MALWTEAIPSCRSIRPSRSDRDLDGIVVFLVTAVISTTLDAEGGGGLTAGISEAIVVIGWIALWGPAERVAAESIPHRFTRMRYRELTDVRVEFR
jgi:hypothetical protein